MNIAIYIIAALLLWSTNFVAIRAALQDYSPVQIAVIRFLASSIILIAMSLYNKIRVPSKRDWLQILIMGLLIFVNYIALIYGTRTITAGETTLIIGTSQIFQVLFALILLKERISRRFLIGLFLCITGITVIAFQNSHGFSLNLGVIYVLIAAITIALFFVMQKPLLKTYSPLAIIGYTTWIASIGMLPFGLNIHKQIVSTPFGATAIVIYMSFAAIFAGIFWAKVIKQIPVSRAAIFLYLIPVSTIIIGFFWLGELPSVYSLIGGVIILTGVVLSNT